MGARGENGELVAQTVIAATISEDSNKPAALEIGFPADWRLEDWLFEFVDMNRLNVVRTELANVPHWYSFHRSDCAGSVSLADASSRCKHSGLPKKWQTVLIAITFCRYQSSASSFVFGDWA